MRAYLDGIPVTNKTETLMKPVIIWRRKDEEGAKAFSFSGDLTFYGADYDYLKSKLWNNFDSNGANISLQTEVKLKFEDECCEDFPVEFRLTAESIKWCEGSCELNIAALETSPEEEAIRCIRNTLITDNTATNWPDSIPFTQRQHPRFTYCNELRPRWLHSLIMTFAIMTGFVLTILAPLYAAVQATVSAINSVINAINNALSTNINTITFPNDPGQGPIDEFRDRLNNLLSQIIGCGRKHPSPLMRDYVKNVCGKCGLQFQSSILNDQSSDYFNAAYFNAPVDKGLAVNDTTSFWINNNAPIKSGEQFLNDLASLFNAKWNVQGSILTFERRDFAINTTPFIDTTQMDSDTYSVCYSWSKKLRAAYGTFEYQRDAVNTVGAEVIRRWGDVVEWNSPPLPNQKGEFKPFFNFAACRFIGDRIRMSDGPDVDVYSLFQNEPFVGPILRDLKGALILNQHVCFLPIPLIWDGKDILSAEVSGSQFVPPASSPNFPAFANNSEATPNEYFNYPFWFDAEMPDNMYPRFWEIENPRAVGFQGKVFELTVELTCANVQACDLDGSVKVGEGLSTKIDNIEFNFSRKTITITGEI